MPRQCTAQVVAFIVEEDVALQVEPYRYQQDPAEYCL